MIDDAYNTAISDHNNDDNDPTLSGSHLLASFKKVRPSLSHEDIAFYESVYARYYVTTSTTTDSNTIIIRFRQVSGDTNYPVADSGNDINRQRVALK